MAPLSEPGLRRVARILLVCYLLAALVLLLTPTKTLPSGAISAGHDLLLHLGAPHLFLRDGVIGFGLNIVLFVPLVLLGSLSVRPRPVWWWVAAGWASSALIEFLQLALPGRDASVVDVVANTSGALIGAVAARVVRERTERVDDQTPTPVP